MAPIWMGMAIIHKLLLRLHGIDMPKEKIEYQIQKHEKCVSMQESLSVEPREAEKTHK